ncbi:MAG: gamma-glutamyltransferase [Alphaproteobacteria bacterium]
MKLFAFIGLLVCPSIAKVQAAGIVVGDEPFAVQAGAGILEAGGSAADAATATYFALSVTYPIAAGLGGGGICLVRDRSRGSVESLDFLPRNVRSGGAIAVPGNVRGIALLHVSYGRLPWQSLVAPAERLATLGYPMSRALAERVTGASSVLRLDASLANVYVEESGRVRRQGVVLRDPELGASLAALRTGGAGALYGGKLGRAIANYAQAQNAIIAEDELVRYAVGRSPAHATRLGDQIVYFPSTRTGSGRLIARIFSDVSAHDLSSPSYENMSVATSAALQAFGVSALPTDLGATGFAAADDSGQAVACAVTMSGPFGSGRTVPGTGITLANAPASSNVGIAVAFLAPLIASDGEGGALTMVAAGAGGPDSTAAILGVAVARALNTSISLPAVNRTSSVNVIACTSDGCLVRPRDGSYGIAAFARESR